MNLDKFGAIIDSFLKENKIQMLLTIPEGTLDVQVKENAGLGSVVQFYILLNTIKPISRAMQKDMGIDGASPEWSKTVDSLLHMVKAEIIEQEAAHGLDTP